MSSIKDIYISNYENDYKKDIQLQFADDEKFTNLIKKLCEISQNYQNSLVELNKNLNSNITSALIKRDYYKLKENQPVWNIKEWAGIESFNGENVWHQDEHTYYNDGIISKELVNGSWIDKIWSGLQVGDLIGKYIWTDGIDIYYNFTTLSKKLNISTNTWVNKTWNTQEQLSGNHIWHFQTHTFYSFKNIQYEIVNGQLVSYDWSNKNIDINHFYGKNVWHFKGHTFYSWFSWNTETQQYDNEQKELISLEGDWIETWNTLIDGKNIWNDKINTYYSEYSTQKIFTGDDIFSYEWKNIEWQGISDFDGKNVWNDTVKTYYSNSTENYVLNAVAPDWETKIWNGINNFDAKNIWSKTSSGTSLYYSYKDIQKKYDGILSQWYDIKWIGLDNFYGEDIWTYKDSNNYEHIMYSHYDIHKELNQQEGKWENITWTFENTNFNHFWGRYIWTKENKIFYSKGDNQGEVITNTHLIKKCENWGNIKPYANNIWKFLGHTYYSNGNIQKEIFDNIMQDKVWNGLTNFYGKDVWVNDTNAFYSNGTSQKMLENSNWSTIIFGGISEFDGEDVWTYKGNFYLNRLSIGKFYLDCFSNLLGIKPYDYMKKYVEDNNISSLTYNDYILILNGKQIQNSYNGTNIQIFNTLKSIFKDEYDFTLQENNVMQITYTLKEQYSPLTPTIEFLFKQGYFTPKPLGVEISYVVQH